MVKALLAGSLVAAGLILPAPNAQAQGYCVDDFPHICQPGNPEGKPAACYDDGGVIVALWPCHVVRLNPNTDAWDIEADPGSPDYDYGATYDDPDEAVYQAGYIN